MRKSNAGKHGIPVLAYLTPEPLSLLFSLRVQYHEARKQVTLMLRTPTAYLNGTDDDLAFVAQYDADNLRPGTAIDAATVHVPPARLAEIERYPTSSKTTTLTLSLEHPCPLWCPRLESLLPAPSPRAVESFNELVQFAKATTVHIVFDREWLSPEQQAPLRWLVKGKETLSGFPVGDYYARYYRRADWTVFGPLAEPLHKRGRRASDSPSSPPPYKRANVDDIPSPTELATSPASPRTPSPSKAGKDETDFQTRAISTVVQGHLAAVVGALLPSTLDERLAALLPTLFTLPASFSSGIPDSHSSQASPPSSSHTSHPLSTCTAPPPFDLTQPHHLTPLGLSLLPHLLAHLTPQLSKLHTTALSRHITYAASTHALELEESAQDFIAEIQQVGDQGVRDLQQQAGYVLDEVREKGSHVREEVAEELEDRVWEAGERVLGDVVRRLEGRVKSKASGLAQCGCTCACPCVTRDAGRLRGTDRVRVAWAKRGKGGYRNLGDRWRTVATGHARWR
ncbi:hypothetical protein SVAN01_03509 [Stagonosporopsis vannaccii]|nr:hypothetical protein SVAN01_03509 [Stagonosporopsis vannaccii]